MRWRSLLAAALLAAPVLAAPFVAASAAASAEDGPAPKPGPAPEGLVLETKLVSPPRIEPGEPVEIEVVLANRGTTDRKVVRPGDGSESGWREPHVFWTATATGADGTVRKLVAQGVGRCGLYDADWHDEVMSLAPGKSVAATPAQPSHLFELQEPGRVEFVAHYVYSAGALGKGRESLEGAAPKGTGGMGDAPAFEVASKPVAVEVVRPLDLRVTARGTVVAGKPVRLRDVLEVRAVLSEGPARSFRSDEWDLLLRTEPWQAVDHVDPPEPASRSVTVAPGRDLVLVGAGAPPLRVHFETVTFAAPGTVRVRAELARRTGLGSRLASRWCEVRVVEASTAR